MVDGSVGVELASTSEAPDEFVGAVTEIRPHRDESEAGNEQGPPNAGGRAFSSALIVYV